MTDIAEKSSIFLRTEQAIEIFNKATEDVKILMSAHEGGKLVAPEAALKTMWHLYNIAYNHGHQLRFNMVTNDCYDIGTEYKFAINNFINAYLELIFPDALKTPNELDVAKTNKYWRDVDSNMWYNRPRVDKETNQAVGLFQSYRRFVITSTGFIYGDCLNAYSVLLRPVYEAIVLMDRDIIQAARVLAVNEQPDSRKKGIRYIDQRWLDAILGDREPARLGQAVPIPSDIFRQIYSLVPPFSSILQQTEEFQLYKTTFQICAYNAVDWVKERVNVTQRGVGEPAPNFGVLGESILAKSCVFEI